MDQILLEDTLKERNDREAIADSQWCSTTGKSDHFLNFGSNRKPKSKPFYSVTAVVQKAVAWVDHGQTSPQALISKLEVEQPHPLWILGKSRAVSPWNMLLDMQSRGSGWGGAFTVLPRLGATRAAWLPLVLQWLDGWTRGGQLVASAVTSAELVALSPVAFSSASQAVTSEATTMVGAAALVPGGWGWGAGAHSAWR